MDSSNEHDESGINVQRFSISTKAIIGIISALASIGLLGGGSAIYTARTANVITHTDEEFRVLESRVEGVEKNILQLVNDAAIIRDMGNRNAGKLDAIIQKLGGAQ